MPKIHKPGKKCEVSGIYQVVWRSTGKPTRHQRTVSHGDRLPPPPSAGQGYVLRKRTKT